VAAPSFCAIDFGTSNSAVALPQRDGHGEGMALVPLEGSALTMPTAVFYFAEGAHDADGPPRAFGRAALQAYVNGHDGRLMRSMKSILGSDLLEQHTDVGGGRSAKYADVVAGYLKRLKRVAEAQQGQALTHAVLGRPVFFVDEDPARDAQAQAALEAAARTVGFAEVAFQFEPIAAAFDYERQAQAEQLVLVADIGGGTSDFSLVRVGPDRMARADRRDDILAHHGLHVAGTDFDRRVALDGPMRALGHGALGPARSDGPPREVPSGITFDLATWHLINTCYTPSVLAEMRQRRADYADPAQHRRLMTVLEDHLGHHLADLAEAGKIALGGAGEASDAHDFDLALVERGLHWPYTRGQLQRALATDVAAIAHAAAHTARLAGLKPERVDALYFTGGSTGLALLREAIAASFPTAARVQGDALASVGQGLALHARRVFG
jgi:hypothetical chaperone protein